MDAAARADSAIEVSPSDPVPATPTRKHLARLALLAFVFTFVAARTIVYLIMSRRVPDLYLYVGQTHVHHLNYGIFLLCAAGAVLLFGPRTPRQLRVSALLYGVGLALTFDEFGMWLHLGGFYWQRLSLDAIVIVAALLTLAALAPSWRDVRARDLTIALYLLVAVGAFALAALDLIKRARVVPELEQLEQRAPQ
jgi:hypothetical protein